MNEELAGSALPGRAPAPAARAHAHAAPVSARPRRGSAHSPPSGNPRSSSPRTPAARSRRALGSQSSSSQFLVSLSTRFLPWVFRGDQTVAAAAGGETRACAGLGLSGLVWLAYSYPETSSCVGPGRDLGGREFEKRLHFLIS